MSKCQHRDNLDRHYHGFYHYAFCPACGADLKPKCLHTIEDPLTAKETKADELGHLFCPRCRVKL